MNDVTRMLNALSAGDLSQQGALFETIYAQLRAMASKMMAREPEGHTLQATALAHEAYLRLVGTNSDWQSRKYFFAAASEAMRRILVEGARRRTAAKRGSGLAATEFAEENHTLPVPDERVLQIHAALDGLEQEDPIQAQVVKLRFFVGLNHREIGEMLDLNEKTIRRHWEEAKLRLYRMIKADGKL